MKVVIVDNYDEMSKKAADIFVEQITKKSNSVIGLATGSTPIGLYKQIIKLCKDGVIDFSSVKSFNLDEYCGLDRENNQSYYYFMMDKLFKYINIDKNNIDVPDGKREDANAECKEYEEKINNAGGIDLQLLGIGNNGHVGFNEPDEKFPSNTHVVNLTKSTIDANSRFFDSIDKVPKQALTMGIGTIMRTKRIILLASGKEKADVIHALVKGNVTPKLPASILQFHQDVIIIVDKEAALRL